MLHLDFHELLGGLLSAMGTALPQPDRRHAFAARVRQAVGPGEHFQEPMHVATITGRSRPPAIGR